MKSTFDRHEITIVHNDGHDASFSRVPQKKIAFSVRGWNPMNQNVLWLSEAIGTMRNEDREEDAMVSYIARSGQWTIIDLTKNKPTYDVKFSALPVR